MDAVITLRDVSKSFGPFKALSDVSLHVNRGERVVVCGPSGSGKSTMIRCINRLERHDSGQIIVDGIELSDDTKNIRAVRQEVGMVFQQFNLFPHLTVLENLTIGPIRVRKVPKETAIVRAREYLERVHIPEQSDKYPCAIVRRPAAARRHRALAVHGAADDAVRRTHLRARSRDDQRGARRHGRAGGSGMTMVCVTHEMGFARKVADTMMFMEAGRVIEVAPPEKFFTNAAKRAVPTVSRQDPGALGPVDPHLRIVVTFRQWQPLRFVRSAAR